MDGNGWLRRRLATVASLALAGVIALGGVVATVGDAGAAQQVAVDRPSIVVTATGEASAPADGAIIQLVARRVDTGMPNVGDAGDGLEPGMAEATPSVVEVSPPVSVPPERAPYGVATTEGDVQPIVEALVGAGIAREAIEVVINPTVTFYGPFTPGSAQVLATVEEAQVAAVGDAVAAAIEAGEQARLLFDQVGVGYTVADCKPVERQALADAVAKAREQAEELAEVLGVQLGELLMASRSPAYGAYGGSGCADQPTIARVKAGFYLPPFNPAAEPEVDVYAVVNLIYAIA